TGGRRLGHAGQLCRWTHDVNPTQAFCNKASQTSSSCGSGCWQALACHRSNYQDFRGETFSPIYATRPCRSAYAAQLPIWIHEMNPSQDLCSRARKRGNAAFRRSVQQSPQDPREYFSSKGPKLKSSVQFEGRIPNQQAPRPAAQIVRKINRTSVQNDQFDRYVESISTRSANVVVLRPETCQRPVIPGRAEIYCFAADP
ncbi:hypothetical protein LX81_04410, partial [Palleronia aestuarii]